MKQLQIHRAPMSNMDQTFFNGERWESIPVVSLSDCVTGAEPDLATLCKLCWDDECLYAAFAVRDNTILATFEQRNDPLYEQDVVEIFLAPTGILNFYYEFNFSPRGIIFDTIVLNNDGRADHGRGELIALREWNCDELRVQTHITEQNDWYVSLAIPFSELHFSGCRAPAPGTVWRGNICRIEYGDEAVEYTTWSPTGLVDFHTTERFGELIFVD